MQASDPKPNIELFKKWAKQLAANCPTEKREDMTHKLAVYCIRQIDATARRGRIAEMGKWQDELQNIDRLFSNELATTKP